MPLPEDLKLEIDSLIIHLIEIGLCEGQNFPSDREVDNGIFEVGLSSKLHSSFPLKDVEYWDVYSELRERNVYNIRMLDGALLILYYLVTAQDVLKHRLAFFPSPILDRFETDPEKYLEDELYADIVDKRIVPFPIRFDYTSSTAYDVPLGHPDCHLTLGQYSGCRIPVSAPLTPIKFVEFIIQHFYNSAFGCYWARPVGRARGFQPCLVNDDLEAIHVVVP